jgi:hypothetical protein
MPSEVAFSDDVPNALKIPGLAAMSTVPATAAVEREFEQDQRPRPPSRAMTATSGEEHFTDFETTDAESDAGSDGDQTARMATPMASRSKVDVSSPADEPARPLSGILTSTASGFLNWMTGAQPAETAEERREAPKEDDRAAAPTPDLVSESSTSDAQPATPTSDLAGPIYSHAGGAGLAPALTQSSAVEASSEASEAESEAPEAGRPSSPPPSFAVATATSPRSKRGAQRRRSRSSVSTTSSAGSRRRRRASNSSAAPPARPRSPSLTETSPTMSKKANKRSWGLATAFRRKRKASASAPVAPAPTSPIVQKQEAPVTPKVETPAPTKTEAAASPSAKKRLSFFKKRSASSSAPTSPAAPTAATAFDGENDPIETSSATSRRPPTPSTIQSPQASEAPAAPAEPARPAAPRQPSRASLAINGALHRSLSTALAAVDKLSGVDDQAGRSQGGEGGAHKRRVTFSHAEDAPEVEEAKAVRAKKPIGSLLCVLLCLMVRCSADACSHSGSKVVVQNDEVIRMRNEGAYWQHQQHLAPTRSALKSTSTASLPARSSASLGRAPSRSSRMTGTTETDDATITDRTPWRQSRLPGSMPASDYGKAKKPKAKAKPAPIATASPFPSSSASPASPASPLTPASPPPTKGASAPSSPTIIGRTASYLGLNGATSKPTSPVEEQKGWVKSSEEVRGFRSSLAFRSDSLPQYNAS